MLDEHLIILDCFCCCFFLLLSLNKNFNADLKFRRGDLEKRETTRSTHVRFPAFVPRTQPCHGGALSNLRSKPKARQNPVQGSGLGPPNEEKHPLAAHGGGGLQGTLQEGLFQNLLQALMWFT